VCNGDEEPLEPWVLEEDLRELVDLYEPNDRQDAFIVLGTGFFIDNAVLEWSGTSHAGAMSCCCGHPPFHVHGTLEVFLDNDSPVAGSTGAASFNRLDDVTGATRMAFEDGFATASARFRAGYVFECFFTSPSYAQLMDARIRFVIYLLHDLGCDQSVDWRDWFHFSECQYGPDDAHDPGCERFDANADGDVDLSDAASLQRLFTGSTD
jgi:hypothetical protein